MQESTALPSMMTCKLHKRLGHKDLYSCEPEVLTRSDANVVVEPRWTGVESMDLAVDEELKPRRPHDGLLCRD